MHSKNINIYSNRIFLAFLTVDVFMGEINFSISVQGMEKMTFRIETKEHK